MAPIRAGRRLGMLLAILLAAASSASALSNAYCSSQNTGSTLAQSSIYMSMGRCYDQCKSSSAFAILQGENCWCSDYIPAKQASTDSCNTPCPGYPSDLCGNQSEGLYGYIALGKTPAGTAGASQAASSTSETSSQVTTAPDATSSKPSPVTSVVVITTNGGQVTQTVTSTPFVGASSAPESAKKSSGVSPGVLAAAVTASLFGVALIIALIFFLWRRRRQEREDEKFGGLRDEDVPSSAVNRYASTHSKSGLLSRTYPPSPATQVNISSTQQDMSSSDTTHSPVTPVSDDRRHSRPLMYDQRLNPIMVMDNGSHTSLRTLDDGRDYGRVLKVANPDEGRDVRNSTS